MSHRYRVVVAGLTLMVFGLASGCKPEAPPPDPGKRPVSVINLREVDPISPLQLTGSVKSWKAVSYTHLTLPTTPYV